MKTNIKKIIWAAGFVDGEGLVMIHPSRGKNNNTWANGLVLQVTVSQTQEKPLRVLKSLFGGFIGTQRTFSDNCKPAWQWRVRAVKAENCLNILLPYLIVKRKQAKLGLRFRRTVHAHRIGRVQYTNKEKKIRKELFERMKTLNHRGIL